MRAVTTFVRALLAAALLAACGSPVDADPSSASSTLEPDDGADDAALEQPRALRLAPEADLVAATVSALERWNAVTCLDIELVPYGTPGALRVTLEDEPRCPADNPECAGATDRATFIAVRRSAPAMDRIHIVTHELGHVLGADHLGGHNIMNEDLVPHAPIAVESLVAVCSQHHCGCFGR